MERTIKRAAGNDFFALIFFFLVVFSLKSNVLDVPFFWDEIGIDIPASMWAYENSLNPFMSANANGHPPFTYLTLAVFFKILGISSFSARFPILISVVFSLFFTFKIGSMLYGRAAGFFSSFLVFIIPIFYSQSGLAMSTTFMICFAAASVYYALRKNLLFFSVFSSFLVMVRESGILLYLALYLWLIIRQKLSMKEKINGAIPFVLFIAWVVSNRVLFGWFLFPASAGFFGVTLTQYLRNLLLVASELFISQYRFIISLIILIGFLLYQGRQKASTGSQEALLFLVLLLHILFFSFMKTGFLPRYLVFLYPFFIILGFGAIARIFKGKAKTMASLALFGIMAALFVFSWGGERDIPPGWLLETNMEYIDSVMAHSRAAGFIMEKYPDSRIFSCWPMVSELNYPYLGYVPERMNAKEYKAGDEIPGGSIYYHSVQSNCPYSVPAGLLEVKEFNINGKNAVIYVKE